MRESVLKIKSYKFAIRVVKLYQFLVKEKKEFVLSKQILRAGTAWGFNKRSRIWAVKSRFYQ